MKRKGEEGAGCQNKNPARGVLLCKTALFWKDVAFPTFEYQVSAETKDELYAESGEDY